MGEFHYYFVTQEMKRTTEDKSFLDLFTSSESSTSDIPLPHAKRHRRETTIPQLKKCGMCDKRSLDVSVSNSCESCNAHICKECIEKGSALCYKKLHILCNRCAVDLECDCDRDKTCPICAPVCKIDGCTNPVICSNCWGGGMCKLCPSSTGCIDHAGCGVCDRCGSAANYCPKCMDKLTKRRLLVKCNCEEKVLCIKCTAQFREKTPRKRFKCRSCENRSDSD